MTWGRWVGAVAVLAVVAAGCADDAAPPVEDRPTLRVLLAGDSITVGYYAGEVERSFGALLVDEWSTLQDVEESRAEESGARGWRVARLVEEMDDPGWDVVVLEVGANDVGKTPVGEYRRDYRRLVRAAELGEPQIVVCLGPWNDGERTPPYDRVVARVCDGEGRVHAPLSDLYDDATLRGPVGTATGFGPRDDFHPNDDGHAAIARRVADVVATEVQ